MTRGTSVAHTKGQILRELMGRANFMSRDVRYAKHANQREMRKLKEKIDGKHGINCQCEYVQKKCRIEEENIRQDLAQTIYSRRRINPRQFRRSWDLTESYEPKSQTDAINMILLEKENVRNRRNERLLRRLKSRSRRADGRVKNFIEKIEHDNKKQKKDAFFLPKINMLTITHEESPTSSSDTSEITPSDDTELAPDGKLRAKLMLPNIEISWEQAKRTRYIRTRFLREFERELTFKEIFGWERLPPIVGQNPRVHP